MQRRRVIALAFGLALLGTQAVRADEWRKPEEVGPKSEWQSPAETPAAPATPTSATTSATDKVPDDKPTDPAAPTPTEEKPSASTAPTEEAPPTVAPAATKKAVAQHAVCKDPMRRNRAIEPYNKGVTLYEAKHYDLALAQFQAASKVDPTFGSPHLNSSMVYYYKRDWSNALKEVEAAMAVDPGNENPTVLLNAGLFSGNCHQFDKAMAFFNKALEYAPDDDTVYTDRGNLYLRMNQHEKAMADYQKALAINPKNEQAIANKALIESGNWSGAFTEILLDKNSKKPLNKPPSAAKPPSHAPVARTPGSKKRK